jgi:hypothetical protein
MKVMSGVPVRVRSAATLAAAMQGREVGADTVLATVTRELAPRARH